MNELRTLLINAVQREINDENVAIFFSGGTENNYLYQIGTSVITTMTVNHDPQSVVGFHKDGSPVQTRLGLTFQEIEYITSADKLVGADGDQRVGMTNPNDFNSHDAQIKDRRDKVVRNR